MASGAAQIPCRAGSKWQKLALATWNPENIGSDGRIAPGGGLPVNTNGGGLSYCHPGMYGLFLLIEAARQLRRECVARQIADCDTAIAHGNGGVLLSQSTVILGTQATI